MSGTDVDAFLAYIRQRGIPEQYHATYRREAAAMLLEQGRRSLRELDGEALHQAVRHVEQALRNRRAVVTAVDAFVKALAAGWSPGEASGDDEQPDSIRAMGSPAVAVTRPGEHRRFVRVPFNGAVQVSGAAGGGNRASDISVGGLYLESRQSWEMGERLDLTFRLHPNEAPLEVRGEVVFVDHGMGAGIDFIDPPREVRHAIRRFVEAAVARERERPFGPQRSGA